MKNFIYCLYNKLSLRYGDVRAYATDATAGKELIKQFRAANLMDILVDETEIVKVGEIEIETGIVTPLTPVRIPLPLAPSDPLEGSETRMESGVDK